MEGWRECHIQPDWLLIYKTTDTEVLLAALVPTPICSAGSAAERAS
jgi:addiction module RelE/StbE family toxin